MSALVPLVALLCHTEAFYVPGVAPIDFRKSEQVEIRAVKMTSSKTQLPYEYYSLPFCKPEEGINYQVLFRNKNCLKVNFLFQTLNLGEVLRGDRIVNTAYDVRMNERVNCKLQCTVDLKDGEAKTIMTRIQEDYFVHLLADNLPAATRWELDDDIVQVIFYKTSILILNLRTNILIQFLVRTWV